MPKKTKDHLTSDQIKDRKLRRVYIAEEMTVLLCTLVGVIVSDAIQKKLSGKAIFTSDFLLDLPNFAIAVVVALIYYGTQYSNFKDFTSTRPALAKRISAALLAGIAWRTLTSVA